MKKRVSAALYLILILGIICGADSVKSNDTHAGRCGDRPEECLIGEMEADEYSMESETGRRLLQVNTGQAVTAGTGDANQPAVACGDPRYVKCLPNPNRSPAGTNCGIYNRECP